VLGQILDLSPRATNANESSPRIDLLHERGCDYGAADAQKPTDAENEVVGLRAVRRKERRFDLSDLPVGRLDDEAAAGGQSLLLAVSHGSNHPSTVSARYESSLRWREDDLKAASRFAHMRNEARSGGFLRR
jgi:hypothetical protein